MNMAAVSRFAWVSVSLWLIACGKPIIYPQARVSGFVYVSGPLEGAVVTAYRLNDDCTRGDKLGEAEKTSESGAYRVDLGLFHGDVLLEAGGPALYEEIASGETVAVDPGVALSAVVLDLKSDERREDVIVSGMTLMAHRLACARHALAKDGSLSSSVQRANALLGAHLFDVDFTRTKAVSLAGQTSLTPEVRHTIILAGLSELARTMARMSVPMLSTNEASTLILVRKLADDLASAEALLDGTGPTGGLSLGSCATVCTITSDTLRAALAKAVLDWLNGQKNPSPDTINYTAAALRITALTENAEPELFGTRPPAGGGGGIDTAPPRLSWVSPHDRDAVSGALTLEVSATDETQVTTLTVTVNGAAGPDDQDAAPERYRGTLDTTKLPDGPLTLVVLATDPAGHRAEGTLTVTVVNNGPGVITGLCMKGPLKAATATAFQYSGGVVGPQLGATATTDSSGRFVISGLMGYSGPVLVMCGGQGATYEEEAFASPPIALAAREVLRTVIPSYTTNSANCVVTPWTTLATTYLEFLVRSGQSVTTAHPAAFAAMADLLGVADIQKLAPAALDASATTFTDETWTALALAGLSQLAAEYAADGQVTPGTAVNGFIMTQRLSDDLADGCFDGKDREGKVILAGGVPLTRFALRYELAEAIGKFMAGSYNKSGLRSARDAIDRLDHLSTNGPQMASAGCTAGELYAEPGAPFDREPPVIVWDASAPLDGSAKKAPFVIKAVAQDAIDPEPMLIAEDPPTWWRDDDSSASGLAVTVPETFEGELVVKLLARDGAFRESRSQRTIVVKNSGAIPEITLVGVTRADGWTKQDVTVSVRVDAGVTVTTMLDGRTVTVPYVESAPGRHLVEATTIDAANNMVTEKRSFTIDKQAPVLRLVSPTGDFVKGTFAVTAMMDDDMAVQGSLAPPEADTLVATVSMAGGAPAAPLPSGTSTVELQVTLSTTAANDGAVRVSFAGRDRAGNMVTAEWSATIDNTPPAPVVTASVGQDAWTKDPVTITVAPNEVNLPPDGIAVLVNNNPLVGSVVAGDGDYTVTATVTDKAGNKASAAPVRFHIDTIPPVIQWDVAPPEGGYTKTPFDLSAHATDASGQQTLEVTSPAGFVNTATGGATVSGKVSGSEGQLTITLVAKDKVHTTTATRTVTVDNTAPKPSITAQVNGTSLAANAWTRGPVTVTVNAGEPAESLKTVSVTKNGVLWTPSTLMADDDYTIEVVAEDKAGNVGQASSSFHLDAIPPDIYWDNPALGKNPGDPAPGTTRWIKTAPTAFKFQAKATDARTTPTLKMTSPKLVTALADVLMTDLTGNNGDWLTITLEAADLAGSTMSSQLVRIDNNPPTATIGITDGKPLLRNTTSVTLGGSLDDGGLSGVAQYTLCKKTNGGTMTDVGTYAGTGGAWSQTVTGLTEGTHVFMVRAKDAAGNESACVEAQGKTVTVDLTAPTGSFPSATTTKLQKEDYYTITFDGVGTPTYGANSGAYVLLDGATPTVTKYATRYTKNASDNPLTWQFQVNEANGVAQVIYRVWYPTQKGGQLARVTPEPVNGVDQYTTARYDGATKLASFTLVEGASEAYVQSVPGLKTVRGAFRMDVAMIDQAGNTGWLTLWFNNNPLAPPLYITAERLPVTSAAAEYFKLESNNMDKLLYGAFGGGEDGGLMKLRVVNRTSEPAYASFFLPPNGGWVTSYGGDERRSWLDLGELSGQCDGQPNSCYTNGTPSIPAAGRTGCSYPANCADNPQALGGPLSLHFHGPPAHCPSCTTTASGESYYYTWLIGAGEAQDVIVSAQDFSMLSPGNGTQERDISTANGWVHFTGTANSPQPYCQQWVTAGGETICGQSQLYQRYTALLAGTVRIDDTGIFMRAAASRNSDATPLYKGDPSSAYYYPDNAATTSLKLPNVPGQIYDYEYKSTEQTYYSFP